MTPFPKLAIQDFVESSLFSLEDSFFEHGSFKALLPKLNELRSEVKSLGWWAPHMPIEVGGMGLSLVELAKMGEILGQSPLGHYVFGCQAPDAGNMEVLHQFGSPEQQSEFLKPLVAGRIRSCFSMTEPEFAGSNPVNLGTTAIRDGDHYVINGHKWFTTGADGASFAIVMAVTNPNEQKHLRASQIIVPLDLNGVERVRNISIMGENGEDWFSHSEMRYTNVRVPVSNRIGGEGFGFMIAQKRLGPGRIHHCMRWIGICERALSLMCRRAATRELDIGVHLSDKQTIQNWIAESRAEINASRLLVMQAAQTIDEAGSSAARKEVSIIKFFVADVLHRVLDRAIQTHGALGITDETPLSFWYRHERGARIYDGPDEVHKARVARLELKPYKQG
ncbi:MAG: acyl-CoA dehydrogenase family protein [Myxococcota bacterium]